MAAAPPAVTARHNQLQAMLRLARARGRPRFIVAGKPRQPRSCAAAGNRALSRDSVPPIAGLLAGRANALAGPGARKGFLAAQALPPLRLVLLVGFRLLVAIVGHFSNTYPCGTAP